MFIYHNDKQHLHQGKMEMYRGEMVPCFENPSRAGNIAAELERRGLGRIEPAAPDPARVDAVIGSVHTAPYLDFLRGAWDEWLTLDPRNRDSDILPSVWPVPGMRRQPVPRNFAARLGLYTFDLGTPLTAGTWEAARAGAGCALAAAERLLAAGEAGFVLTRPPGHHAGPGFFGGYCYINNAAVAAQALRDGGVERVAIVDVDYHHGNGTQEIFYRRPDVLFASIHGDPATEYPFYLGHADERGEGEGEGCNLNLPLPHGTGVGSWFEALDRALEAVTEHGSGAIVVSLGLDTFEGDPISGFRLRGADFLALGARLAALGLPTLFILEGGYAVAELGENAVNVLEGFGG